MTGFLSLFGLCQRVLMASKTPLQKRSRVFLFPSASPAFFQIGTITYQHRLRFRRRGFMYEFLPLIRKSRTHCYLTGFHLAARSAQLLSLGRLALAFEQAWCSKALKASLLQRRKMPPEQKKFLQILKKFWKLRTNLRNTWLICIRLPNN